VTLPLSYSRSHCCSFSRDPSQTALGISAAGSRFAHARKRLKLLPLKFPAVRICEVLRFAQDLASRLPLRSRLLNGSTWKAVTLPLSYSRETQLSALDFGRQLSAEPSAAKAALHFHSQRHG